MRQQDASLVEQTKRGVVDGLNLFWVEDRQ
jgi:hypothetical protein